MNETRQRSSRLNVKESKSDYRKEGSMRFTEGVDRLKIPLSPKIRNFQDLRLDGFHCILSNDNVMIV